MVHQHTDIGADVGVELLPDPHCSEMLVAGCTMHLECSPPDGYPAVRISWYKNGEKLRQITSSKINFSNNKRMLTIHNASYADSGIYQCRATSDLFIMKSSKVITIQVKGEQVHMTKSPFPPIQFVCSFAL